MHKFHFHTTTNMTTTNTSSSPPQQQQFPHIPPILPTSLSSHSKRPIYIKDEIEVLILGVECQQQQQQQHDTNSNNASAASEASVLQEGIIMTITPEMNHILIQGRNHQRGTVTTSSSSASFNAQQELLQFQKWGSFMRYSVAEMRLSTHRLILIGIQTDSRTNTTAPMALHFPLAAFSLSHVEKKKSGFFSSAKLLIYVKASMSVFGVPQGSSQQRQQHQVPFSATLKIKFKANKHMDRFYEALERQLKAKSWEHDEQQHGSSAHGGNQSQNATGGAGANNNTAGADSRRNFGLGHAGIGGLQKHRIETSNKQKDSLQAAFQDLDSLMESARDMVKLARRFSSELSKRQDNSTTAPASSNAQLDREVKQFNDMLMNMGMTDAVVSKHSAGNLFHTELARQLTDFLKKPLERSQGMITMIDAYCLYNRARGTDLISPEDMLKACGLLEDLQLPMRMQTFESGVIVLTDKLNPTKDFMDRLKPIFSRSREDDDELFLSGVPSARGVSALDTAHALQISVALAQSRLEQAEEELYLCRDECPQGIFFYENFFFNDELTTMVEI